MDQNEKVWEEVCQRIKKSGTIMDFQFNTWLAPIERVKFGSEVLFLWLPNSIAANTVKNNYADLIRDAVYMTTGKAYERIEVLLHNEEEPPEEQVFHKREEQDDLSASLNPKYTFDSFVVGTSNRMAHAYSLAVAETPGKEFNPLFIYGNSGLGKTHLSQAIAHFLRHNDKNANILYVSSEQYTNEFIDSLRDKRSDAFREKYRNADLLIVDDIQFISGKDSTVEEFFHTFNVLTQNGKQIVLTSDRPPKNIMDVDARLISRFLSGLTCEINPPDYETRIAILKNKATSENCSFTDDIYQYIAENVRTNIRELEGALNKIIAYDRLQIEPITEPVAARILQDFITKRTQKVTYEMVKNEVCNYFHTSIEDILSKKRTKNIALARQIAIFICFKNVQNATVTSLSKEFDRDHSTVSYALSEIEKAMEQDEEIANMVRDISMNLVD